MSLNHSPKIITSGIYSLYDPKNTKSYPGSGTTLIDIIGNQNLTIYGSPTFNSAGYFELGDNQTTQYLMNSSYTSPTTEITYNIWFRSRFTSPAQTPFTYSVGGNNEMLFYCDGATSLTPFPLGTYVGNSTTNMTSLWVNFSWTRISLTGVNYFYRDGKQIGTYTGNTGTNITSGGYLIIGQEADTPGGGFDANQNLDGDFGFFSIYNRVLSSTEVNQNFQALRGRYGI